MRPRSLAPIKRPRGCWKIRPKRWRRRSRRRASRWRWSRASRCACPAVRSYGHPRRPRVACGQRDRGDRSVAPTEVRTARATIAVPARVVIARARAPLAPEALINRKKSVIWEGASASIRGHISRKPSIFIATAGARLFNGRMLARSPAPRLTPSRALSTAQRMMNADRYEPPQHKSDEHDSGTTNRAIVEMLVR